MSELEKYVFEQIKKLVPAFEKLEVRANIGDNSYSVEFFVTIDGEKMQCYDMVDNGLLKEKDIDTVSKAIAEYVRKMATYENGKINKIAFTV